MRCISCSKSMTGEGAFCPSCAATAVSENPLAFMAAPLAGPSPLQGIAMLSSPLPSIGPSASAGGRPSPYELERWPFVDGAPDAQMASQTLERLSPSPVLDPRRPPALDLQSKALAGRVVRALALPDAPDPGWETLCRAANMLMLAVPSREEGAVLGPDAEREVRRRLESGALDLYGRACQGARDQAVAARNRGVALVMMGRHKEGEEVLSEVFEDFLDDAFMQYSMAAAAHAQGRHAEASRFIDNALHQDDACADFWLLKGAVSLAAGDRAGASEAYEAAIELDDGLAGVREWLEREEGFDTQRKVAPVQARATVEKEAELEARAKDVAAKERELYERVLQMTRETSLQRERDLQALRVERLDLEGRRKELDAERERLRKEASAKETELQSRMQEALAAEKGIIARKAELDAREKEIHIEKENIDKVRKGAFKGSEELERKLRKIEALERELDEREDALRKREEEISRAEKDLRIRTLDIVRQDSDLKTRASEAQTAEAKLSKLREDVEERLRLAVRERGELNALAETLEGRQRDMDLKERILATQRDTLERTRIQTDAREADRYVEGEVKSRVGEKVEEERDALLEENQRLQRAIVERERQLREFADKAKSERERQVSALNVKIGDLEKRIKEGDQGTPPALEGKEPSKRDEAVSRVRMLQSSGRHAEAVAAAEAFVNEFGTSVDILLLKADSQIERGEEDKALSTLELALSISPKNEAALVGKGRCLHAMGNFEEALKLFDKVGEANPANADAWYRKAETLNRMGRWGGAIQFYNQTLSVNDKHAGAWIGKGDILSRRGKHEEARACYDQAIAVDDRSYDAWMGKAATLAELGRWGGALQAIDMALAVKPGDPEALLEKGKVYIKQGEREKGLAELDSAEKADPSSAKPHLEKARALRSLGRNEAAMSEVNKAIEKGGQTAELLRERGYILLDMGKGEKAMEELNRARALDPKDRPTFLAVVRAMTATGSYDDALAMLDAELKDNEDATLLKARASVLMDMSLYEDSVKTYGRALMLDEDDVDTWLGLGIVLREKGEMNRAIKTFDKVLELDGKSKEGWLNKGITFQRLEKDKEALLCYDKALEVDPEFAEVKKWRDTLQKKVKRRGGK